VVFLIPGAIALVVEPIIFLYSDRYPRKWFVTGGLAAMALGAFASAFATGPITLSLAIGVWWIAIGSASALAQGTLVDRDPDRRARTLARWTLASLAGDLLAPAVLAGFAALALSWREAFMLVGAVLVIAAVISLAQPREAFSTGDDEEDEEPLWPSFRAALKDRVLILWLFGCTLCDLLDEILVVFASLHLRRELGADTTEQALMLGSLMLGGAIGLVLLDRLLAKHSETRLLIACALACAVSYAIWLLSPSIPVAIVLMFPVGVFATPLYPLAAARAYARCPGRSGLVLAAQHLFTPLGLALPFLLGIVADEAGTFVALAVLTVQPLGLALLAAADGRRGSKSHANKPELF
jgi:MFS family permease